MGRLGAELIHYEPREFFMNVVVEFYHNAHKGFHKGHY